MGINDGGGNIEYYKRFPATLRDALLSRRVEFPATIRKEYEDLVVYRGVKISKNKSEIDKSDFMSNVERKKQNPLVVADEDRISSYSCSCFMNIEMMKIIAKFPRKNSAIARGIIKDDFGPIDINEDTSHVDLFLFDMVDPSMCFEVVE